MLKIDTHHRKNKNALSYYLHSPQLWKNSWNLEIPLLNIIRDIFSFRSERGNNIWKGEYLGFLKHNPENSGILEDSQIIPNLIKLLGIASDASVHISKASRSVGSHGDFLSLWLESVFLISSPVEVHFSLLYISCLNNSAKVQEKKAELVQTKHLLVSSMDWAECFKQLRGA